MTTAKALSPGDVVTRVIMGRLCFLFDEKLHADRTTIRGPDGVRWVGVTDAPEDASLREAWERFVLCPKCEGRAIEPGEVCKHCKSHGYLSPPDQYLVARGPGVVACEVCRPELPGWSMMEAMKACRLCNPTALEHPTLVPLAELEEVEDRFIEHAVELERIANDTGKAMTWHGFLMKALDLAGLIVTRSEECPECAKVEALGARVQSHTKCGNTGRIETVNVYWREL